MLLMLCKTRYNHYLCMYFQSGLTNFLLFGWCRTMRKTFPNRTINSKSQWKDHIHPIIMFGDTFFLYLCFLSFNFLFDLFPFAFFIIFNLLCLLLYRNLFRRVGGSISFLNKIRG